MSTSAPPTSATDSVLVASGPMPEGAQEVRGVDFDQFQGRDITVAEMVENMTHMGFQGSAVAEAARIINEMVRDVPLQAGPLVGTSKLILPCLQ
jgi:deoxyhypusine synthase